MKLINGDEFNETVLASEAPVLVDFFAPWCHPCKQLGPILEALKEHYGESLSVVKVDIDEPENYSLVTSLAIRSVPSLKLYKAGKCRETIVGLPPKDKLEASVAALVAA
jgi:thioredoxin 1